ncbi:U-box domain-containing protein 21-like [Tripterygium wilfordii]|uniref:U-box domain-containing protein n=1 Tax=Tripterygium wilfordii TaxID=458696 RepID=A0A7J7CUV1_TRIWF|nr:U-box domain-containing protein 21-like [Tripterygium wilfordii]KAF5737902.1 U-box domain-containing protein 21-like [Tripterygium wilfordii]
MILPWNRRRNSRSSNKSNYKLFQDNLDVEVLMVPLHFRCPISLDLMKDPVTLCTGITYDRESIEKWIESGNCTCPVTNQVLLSFDQIPNHSLRKMIQDWCVQNRSSGIERIPTPRIPVSHYEVSETCKRIMVEAKRGDVKKIHELVQKIKNWGKESDRNKRCIVSSDAGCVLSACFESFANVSMEKNVELLEEIMSTLTWLFPLGVEGQAKLGSPASLRCMVEFMKSRSLLDRQNAVLVLKETVYSDQIHITTLVEIEGVFESLVSIVRDPICTIATKASLMTILQMISTPSAISEKIVSRFEELGLVSLMLEIIVDAEKNICEKALGILDKMCDWEQGREKAYENALTIPVLVKKMLRVSDLATESSVSILWKLLKKKNNETTRRDDDQRVGCFVVEAVQVGAFQKLLVLLQVGCCGGNYAKKVTDLLKLMNLYRGEVECYDSSMDFKYLKRPF